jgi:hypothetical protein
MLVISVEMYANMVEIVVSFIVVNILIHPYRELKIIATRVMLRMGLLCRMKRKRRRKRRKRRRRRRKRKRKRRRKSILNCQVDQVEVV